MKKLISICVSISLLVSFSAPLQAKQPSRGRSSSRSGSSSRSSSSSSSSQSCPLDKISDSTVKAMFKEPSGDLWKNATNVSKVADYLNGSGSQYRKPCRSEIKTGYYIARAACSAVYDSATKKIEGSPAICTANDKIADSMVAAGLWNLVNPDCYRLWNEQTKHYDCVKKEDEQQSNGNSNKRREGSRDGSNKGNRDRKGNGPGVDEEKIEQKVDDAEDDNKDNVVLLKFKHAVDTSFMLLGGKGKIPPQVQEWIDLFNQASSLNANLKGVMERAVSMYVNPDKNSTQGIPAYAIELLFMVYADLADSADDMMPYINYKCNGDSDKDRCAQIRSFASQATLMQVRFRERFDEEGRGSLVDKYLAPECAKLKEEARGKSVFRGETENAQATLDEATKKCLASQMRAYILVKGKATVKKEMERVLKAELAKPNFKKKQVNKAFSPVYIWLLSAYMSLNGGTASAATISSSPAVMTYIETLATSTYSAAGSTAGILELAPAAFSETAPSIIEASSIATVGDLTSAVGIGTVATVGAVATIAVTSSGLMVQGLYDAYAASYPNEANQLRALLRSAIRNAAKFDPAPTNPTQTNPPQTPPQSPQTPQDQRRQNPGDQRPNPDRPRQPRDDKPDDDKPRRPRCEDETRGRNTCEFRVGTREHPVWKLTDIGGYRGPGTPGGINNGDPASLARKKELLICLKNAGVCNNVPSRDDYMKSPTVFDRNCPTNFNKELHTIAAMAPACAQDLDELAEVGRVSKSFMSSKTRRGTDNVRAIYRFGQWMPEPEVSLDSSEWPKVLAQWVIDGFNIHDLINNLVNRTIFNLTSGDNGIRFQGHEIEPRNSDDGVSLHVHYEEFKTYEGNKRYLCNHSILFKQNELNRDYGTNSGYTPCQK